MDKTHFGIYFADIHILRYQKHASTIFRFYGQSTDYYTEMQKITADNPYKRIRRRTVDTALRRIGFISFADDVTFQVPAS